jgi:hypothetical protein
MTTLPLFCDVDDFCQAFAPVWQQVLLTAQPKQRNRKFGLCLSEVMTIIIQFHLSGYRTFKDYYTKEVLVHQRGEFPGLVSYNRFVELMPSAFVPLCVYLHTRFGTCSGISFIDSTKLAICHNRRIWGHKVFADLAARGKSSVDWFYGFKLHLVINDCGELLNVTITAGNVDDRAVVPDLVKDLFGKLFGDKGYVSQPLFEQLFTDGVQLITKLKKGMKERLMSQFDKLLLRKRGISETVNDQLKNISQIEHTRHRSVYNFFVNLLAGLVAYTFREKKPSLHLRDRHLLPAVL